MTAPVAELTRDSQIAADDQRLIAALRAGDEAAFAELVDRYQSMLTRLARMYVSTDAVAQEVVQETWLGVIKGLDRFEGRSSLKTWIFRILVNTAQTRGKREARSIPFSSAADPGEREPSVDVDRFRPADDSYPNNWAIGPIPWKTPEQSLLSGEALDRILTAIDTLPPAQRELITLRDIEGWSSEDARNALGVSETNQRVLLHRARSKVRAAVEDYFGAMERTG